ncbi:MAG: hypothetical protein LBJ89_00420 [Holosporales bacterium]|nr:hypothetical protein [Holosporales bacterium]
MRYNGANGNYTHSRGKPVQKFAPQNANQLKQRAQSSVNRLVNLGKEALAQEDYTEAERCFQNAEHYIRQINGIEAREAKYAMGRDEPRVQSQRTSPVENEHESEGGWFDDDGSLSQRVDAQNPRDEDISDGSFAFPVDNAVKKEKYSPNNLNSEGPVQKGTAGRTTKRNSFAPRRSHQDTPTTEEERGATDVSQDIGSNLIVRKRRIVRKRASPTVETN